MKITKKDTLEYQNKTQEILNEIMWKIIFSKDIKEEEAMRLKIPLLKIKERIEQGTLDPDLLAYLSNLKFDGKKEDLLLLFAISKGINPQMKEQIKEIESSNEFNFLRNSNNTLNRINA